MGLKIKVLVKGGGNLVLYISVTEILQAVNVLEELAGVGESTTGGARAPPQQLLMVSQGEVRHNRVTARGGEELSWTPRGHCERCQLKSVSVLSEREGPFLSAPPV